MMLHLQGHDPRMRDTLGRDLCVSTAKRVDGVVCSVHDGCGKIASSIRVQYVWRRFH